MTYQELDGRANGLAHILSSEIGSKRGDFVGIYMDKSVEMILSILAVYKAGLAYVPLDPEHPADRIQTILGLANSRVVLTTTELCDEATSKLSDTDISALKVEAAELRMMCKPDIGPRSRDEIAHVFFTSGSTGTPKGKVSICP